MMPILTGLGANTEIFRVLELGSGMNSTPLFLNRNVFPNLIELVSFEDDPEWFNKMVDSTEDDRVNFIKDIPENMKRFDLVLVDNSQCDRRIAAIKQVRDLAKKATVVVHDSEVPSYMWEIRKFLCSYNAAAYDPNTAIAWDTPSDLLSKILPMMDVIFKNADRLSPNDTVGWLSVFLEAIYGF